MPKQENHERRSIYKRLDKAVFAGIPCQHQKSIKKYTTKLPGHVPATIAFCRKKE
jgi:hypothetical protein